MNSYLKLLLPIIGIKRLYFHLIPLLIGIRHLKSIRVFNYRSYPLIIMCIISSILSLIYSNFEGGGRVVQFALLVSFYDFALKYLRKNSIEKFLYIPVILSPCITLYDYVFNNYTLANKYLFGFHITQRYWGITFEPNFSAASLGLLFLISIYYKRYLLSMMFLLFSVPTMSRNVVIMLAVFVVFSFLKKYFNRWMKIFSYIFIFLSLATPISFGYLDKVLKFEDKVKVSRLTSERSELYAKYNEIIKEYPFGIGLMNGKRFLSHKEREFSFHKHLEQHSLIIQILTEFGVLGLVCWCYFLFSTIRALSDDNIVLLISGLSLFIFLNGIFEPYLYLLFAQVQKK